VLFVSPFRRRGPGDAPTARNTASKNKLAAAPEVAVAHSLAAQIEKSSGTRPSIPCREGHRTSAPEPVSMKGTSHPKL
jgi:hypothetical protein